VSQRIDQSLRVSKLRHHAPTLRPPSPCAVDGKTHAAPSSRAHEEVERQARLLGALAHLPALALQAAGALLLPLPAHLGVRFLPRIGLVSTAAEAQHQVKGRLLLDVVVRQGAAILQLLAGEDQALLVGRDALLVLDLGLDIVNRVRWLDLQGDGLAREGLHEDLHPVPHSVHARQTQETFSDQAL